MIRNMGADLGTLVEVFQKLSGQALTFQFFSHSEYLKSIFVFTRSFNV